MSIVPSKKDGQECLVNMEILAQVDYYPLLNEYSWMLAFSGEFSMSFRILHYLFARQFKALEGLPMPRCYSLSEVS